MKDKQGKTPLHCAAMANNKATARQLLSLGAYVDPKDGSGKTSLREVIQAGSQAFGHHVGANVR